MPLDPQTIARSIVEERNKGAEMSENLERLLEMYKVCIASSVLFWTKYLQKLRYQR
jgi:hypothetical protein